MSKERLHKQILNQKATRREFLSWCGEAGKYAVAGAGFAGLFGGGLLIIEKLGQKLNIGRQPIARPEGSSRQPAKSETPVSRITPPQETPAPQPQATNHDLLTPEERLKADKSYEGIYYHAGELNSSPERQEGLVHVYGLGEPLNPNYASGFPFQREEFACASWFYPIGTWLKVTNTANGEVVYCRVKDRGPNRIKYPDIIADLTKGARDEIAPSWVGEIQVVIEPAK